MGGVQIHRSGHKASFKFQITSLSDHNQSVKRNGRERNRGQIRASLSSLLTRMVGKEVPVNCRRTPQNFPPMVMSPFVARGDTDEVSSKRLRKYANLAAAAAPCSSLNFAHASRSDY